MNERRHPLEPRRILVVDDEESILTAIDRELFFWRAERGIEVLKASSAAQAMEILRDGHDSILVLISDLKMTEMGGDQLILETKRLYPEIRSILMTGYSEMGGVSKAVSAGISAFIPKPWESAAFISEIEKAMADYLENAENRAYLSKLEAQLERTGLIQRNLFQYKTVPSARYALDVTYRPLDEFRCGGDFYQIVPLSKDRCILMLGDVSGHGVDAAFAAGVVRTLISREDLAKEATETFSPARFLDKFNSLVLREFEQTPDLLVSMTVTYLDCAERRMTICNAGNLPVYIIRRDACETFSVPGCPCGFAEDAVFEDLAVSVRPGDRIALMTDGLLERGHAAGYLNLGAIRAVFSRFVDGPDFNRKIVNFVLSLFPERKFADDVTLITAKLN